MAFFMLEVSFENKLYVEAIYFQTCICSNYKNAQIPSLTQSVIAMETKNIFCM